MKHILLIFSLLFSPHLIAQNQTAIFAGGCFWCMEPPFEKEVGVVRVLSGFSGGKAKNPSYEEVSKGGTGHIEVVQVEYDPNKVNFERLLEIYWQQIDPTDGDGQFVDKGDSYIPAIFYGSESERELAEKSFKFVEDSKRFTKPIKVKILARQDFYPAEDYHQDYYKKNPIRYKYYSTRSGRPSFVSKHWKGFKLNLGNKPNWSQRMKTFKKPTADELKKSLTPEQFKVTQKDGTESPFKNPYWDLKDEGIYVDIVSGEPLFSSLDKYDSGTGWPSFTKPLDKNFVVEKEDRGLFSKRTEIRSKIADSHLGHVFPDGPKPTGLRYCMNSASLRFVPKADMEKEGYGDYLSLFEKKN